MHRLAVVVTSADERTRADTPPEGALEGAGLGALTGAGVGAGFAVWSAPAFAGAGPFGIVVWAAINAVVFPVCVLGGTVYGVAASMPSEELAARLEALEKVFAEAGPDLGLAAETSARLARTAGAPSIASAAAAADATLEVRVLRRGLLGGKGFDPVTSVVVEAEAVLRIGDAAAPTWRATFVYVGPQRHFTEWTGDAPRIRVDRALAASHLAERIVDEAFLVDAPGKP